MQLCLWDPKTKWRHAADSWAKQAAMISSELIITAGNKKMDVGERRYEKERGRSKSKLECVYLCAWASERDERVCVLSSHQSCN